MRLNIDRRYHLWMILVLGLVLRLILLNQSLWLDEAIGAIVAKSYSFRDILLKFPLGDNHPPLYYLILRGWGLVFGYSEVSLRMPSVVFGVSTIYFVYKIAKEFTKVNPVIPAMLLATSPLAIYYSQEARMYMLSGFLAAGGVYFFLRTFKENSKLWNWLGFSLFYTLLIFSDYMPVFLYPVFVIYPLIRKENWIWWKKFFFTNLPLLILGVLWLPIFQRQGEGGRRLLETLPDWVKVAGGANFKQVGVFWSKFTLGRISLINKYIQYSLVFLASIPILTALFGSFKKLKDSRFFWLWFTLPVILGFVVSLAFPAFIYFRYIFVLPAFYLLISLGAESYPKIGRLIAASIVIFNLIGWGIYVAGPRQHRENWKGAVAYVEEKALPTEVIIFGNPEPFAPYRWYSSGKVRALGVTDSISANSDKTEKIVRDALAEATGVYYFEYLKDLEDPSGIVGGSLSKIGFTETERKDFNGVGFVIHYQRKQMYANRN